MVVRRSRKREPEINLSELIWALEDDVIDRRRAKSEPPIRARRKETLETRLHMNFDSAIDDFLSACTAGITWPEKIEAPLIKKTKSSKRRKTAKNEEKPVEIMTKAESKEEITVLVDEEAPSLFMTPPKSPDHEYSPLASKTRLLECVNEYRAQGSNSTAITLSSQLAQMAYCYNNKERPGEHDYDVIEQLVLFYKEAPQQQDPPEAANDPSYFMPQKQYLMRRQVRERLYGAVSLLRSQQVYSRPQIPDHLKNDPMMQSLIEEATAQSRNCHTLALLLEDLHSIPDF
ncbi:hypothetical protein PRIPAC_75415 [Pristionchus pacificus]|uniref:Uncharacterized protein n=1 Tax=Pristionchus pacificus TaxID=54126 RepID=A0A2A6CGE8_PRIPA|nr:hypothetical protein PRIPAC_75415 [Pristionchus pacificus]|eukprot:PDM77157.1 hypothetical protein PRIPAC_43069 [Pristionchus pacificus]